VGQPLSYDNITLRRMNQESGGNPRAVNLWDINAKLGHPSAGLMQVIRPTFQAYAGRFRNKGPFMYGVSVDPLANVYASMRYALSRYGSLPRAYNRAGGYDSGGWLQPGSTLATNLTGKPEAVLTAGQWRTMTAAASAPAGLQPGDQLMLRVEDYEFTAYVDRRADGRVNAGNQRLIQVINAS
jgi:SLT domain-containing protein